MSCKLGCLNPIYRTFAVSNLLALICCSQPKLLHVPCGICSGFLGPEAMAACKGWVAPGLRRIVTSDRCCQAKNEEPMTPKGCILSHTYVQCYILLIVGFKERLDVPSLKAALQYTVNNNNRFSSIVKKGKRGNCRWIREEVDIDKHVIVADVSGSDTQRLGFVEEYAASLANTPLDCCRPLWEIHVLNASAVFKIHHCLGDCASLMSLFLDCTGKVSDPQTLPAIQHRLNPPRRNKSPVPGSVKASAFHAIWNAIFVVWCTLVDLFKSLATILWLKDNAMPRSSGSRRPQPKGIAHLTIDLDDIAIIKKATNSTVNDVVTGILSAGFVSYITRRYESCSDGKSTKIHNLRLRALVPVNMRSAPGLAINSPERSRWGNEFGMWILSIPLEKHEDSLQYCRSATSNSKKKKASFESLYTYFFAKFLSWLMGPNVAAYFLNRLCLNTTLVYSNILGPSEEAQFLGNAITHIVTTVSWLLQPLVVHFQSYAGKGQLAVMASQDFIPDPQQLCMDYMDSLKQMKQAALTTLNYDENSATRKELF